MATENDIQPLTKGFLLDRGSKDQRALSPPEVQEVSNQVMLMLIILFDSIMDLCFHLAEEIILSNILNINTSEQVLDSIKEEICKEGRVYSHVYKPGDFIISDNLAVGHEADPATQLPREEVKLATYPPDYYFGQICFFFKFST